jgi:hypothetical protein
MVVLAVSPLPIEPLPIATVPQYIPAISTRLPLILIPSIQAVLMRRASNLHVLMWLPGVLMWLLGVLFRTVLIQALTYYAHRLLLRAPLMRMLPRPMLAPLPVTMPTEPTPPSGWRKRHSPRMGLRVGVHPVVGMVGDDERDIGPATSAEGPTDP